MDSYPRRLSREIVIVVFRIGLCLPVRFAVPSLECLLTTLYALKKEYEQMGYEGCANEMTKQRLEKIKEIEQEVELLKQLLAEEKMARKLKKDLLKKKYHMVKRKYS